MRAVWHGRTWRLPVPHFPPVLFVLDLDDTLIRWIRPDEKPGNGQIIPARGDILGYRYRVLDGAPELPQSLLADYPHAKVVIYSAGEEERNLKVLRKFRLPNGRSLLDVAYRVRSREDIVPDPSKPPSEKPSRTSGKKDLRKFLGPGLDLDHIILIDDHFEWAYPGQEGNLLWISPKPEKFQATLKDGKQTVEQFVQDRNKLTWARGMVDRVMETARDRGITPRQALAEIQWLNSPSTNWIFDTRLRENLDLYRRGARLLHRQSTQYQFIGSGCTKAFSEFSQQNPVP